MKYLKMIPGVLIWSIISTVVMIVTLFLMTLKIDLTLTVNVLSVALLVFVNAFFSMFILLILNDTPSSK